MEGRRYKLLESIGPNYSTSIGPTDSFAPWEVMKTFVRRNRPEILSKKRVLRNFAKFTGKRLCQSLFFKESCRTQPATLLKKRFSNSCFPVNFAKFLRTPFLTEHLLWLLLFLKSLCAFDALQPSCQLSSSPISAFYDKDSASYAQIRCANGL